MEKTATINVRVDPEVKRSAEAIFDRLGIPTSTAISIFLNQVVLRGGLPFNVTVPMGPKELDMSRMTEEELREKLLKGYEDAVQGRVFDAHEALAKLREKYAE